MTNREFVINRFIKYRNDPVGFVKKVINVEEIFEEQMKVLNNLLKHLRIAIKSGHGIGKTALLAFIILWWFSTRVNSRVIMTSPSQHQLFDVLIPELIQWNNHSGLDNMIEITATNIWMKGHKGKWFGYARACKVGENIAGGHKKNLLIVIEEASGVDQRIIETLEGALTQEGNRLIMIGNPTQLSGAFFNAFHKDRDIYDCHTFNAEESKNVTDDYCNKMARYGKDSDVYRVRVLGQFPKGEPDTFITLDKIERSLALEIKESWDKVAIGVDPARFGNDESVICYRKGLKVMPIIGFHGIDTVRLAGEVVKLARELYKQGHKKTIDVKVDETGIGSGVVDQLNETVLNEKRKSKEDTEFNINVIPIVNNATPTDPDYKDYGSQMWGEMRDGLETIKIPDGDDELIAQLSTRKYKVEPDGKIKLEKKDDMKKRKLPSPDRADALALCLANLNYFDFSNDKVETEERV